MQITQSVQHEFLRLSATGPTVVEPGKSVVLEWSVTAIKAVTLQYLTWIYPDVITPVAQPTLFPVKLEAGDTRFYQNKLIQYTTGLPVTR